LFLPRDCKVIFTVLESRQDHFVAFSPNQLDKTIDTD